MEYLQIKNGEALQITTHGNVEWSANHFCPASALTPDEAALFDIHPLTVIDAPSHDPLTQSVSRDGCELVDGTWRYKWRIDALSVEQMAVAYAASIPQSVTMRQACIQLETDGLLDDVEAIVAVLPRVYQIEWQRASTVARDNPLVEMVRQQQGMTEEQIDKLFIQAATL